MRILVISVHPDDETFGCGGALLKHAAQGDSLHWLLVTAATEPDYSPEQIAQQAGQVEAVRKAFPFDTLDWLKLPTTRLETLPLNQVVNGLREATARVRPQIVYLPNRSDVHSDHRVVFAAASAVLKSFYMRSLGVQRVLSCETLSETDAAPALPENAFLPNVFVDITGFMERKIEIMQLFQSEIQSGAMPRSASAVQALARYRGATVGVEYAEAFMLIREIL